MIQALTMPAWGMEDGAGTVVNWLVKEGDVIGLGVELVEIETTKLANVVESPFAGVLRKIVLNQGDSASPGALLAVIADGAVSDTELDTFIAEHGPGEAQAEEAKPVESFVHTARGKIRVTSLGSGAGKPAVLLHGFGADSSSWAFLFSGLAGKRPVHLVDLPGHGSSFKELGDAPIEALVEGALSVVSGLAGPVHLIGHSLGGLVAIRVAENLPSSVATVSLIAPAGLGNPISGEFLEKFADADSRRNARSAIEMLVVDKDSVSLAMINDVIRARRVEGAKEALHALRVALADGDRQKVDLRSVLDALPMPAQVIVASDDEIIRSGEAGPTPSHTISGAGHLLHMEQAGEVQRHLEQFMERGDD